MIAETLAGISLVKAAVDGIKSTINTANDIGDIAGFIDKLFEGEKQVQQDRAKKSGMGMTDQFGVSTVAREVIDAKIAAEKLQEVATMIDMRFGHGTWKGILEERQKRIREAKEAAAKARKEALQRMGRALDEFVVLGCTTNVRFLRELCTNPDVVDGWTTTDMIDRLWPDGWSPDRVGRILDAGLLIATACESTNHGKNVSSSFNSHPSPSPFSTINRRFP